MKICSHWEGSQWKLPYLLFRLTGDEEFSRVNRKPGLRMRPGWGSLVICRSNACVFKSLLNWTNLFESADVARIEGEV